eukprot:CAMPEP_0197074522 /NCGR_PEP_ID=MMETSP1384-20130603/211151_1 /TAXON_ID=29189 /ORGANISM="Ammonia sp." /LENGTH=534 /DNA_ID=CAMNT_0042513363 /DNA_START=22 /DNA_END=1626 /DNA_ORIENTATION=-
MAPLRRYKLCLFALVLSTLSLPWANALWSDPTGTSCKEDLDCGSNIKYELCDGGKCRTCTSDSECNINKENDICLDEHWCEMDKLTKNFDGYTIATIIAIFVGAFIAAGGGLGGGGIFVPVFILLLNFDAKSASALSQATIFGGSIVNIVMNFREQHPNPNRAHRPLTDFNTILILEPMLLGGTVIGVLLNQILPDVIILVCLILVLTISLYRMVKKGIAQWKKENEQRARREGLLENDHLVQSLVGAADNKDSHNYQSMTGSMDSAQRADDKYSDDTEVDVAILAKQCGQTPSNMKELTSAELTELDILVSKESQVWLPLLWMGAVWVIVSIFALLRSGDFVLKVTKCSALYWILEFGVFPCLFVITFFIAKMNMTRFRRKLELHWKPAEGDIEWSVTKSIIYPSIAAGAGLLGGLLGIGGGMIVSPLLLELGVQPRVASATSAVAVMMTSSSSTFQKILLNMIRYDYMAFFAAIGVIGTFIGQTVVNVAIKKFGRNSIVVAAVASVIAVAIVLMGLNSILSMKWTFQFDSVC